MLKSLLVLVALALAAPITALALDWPDPAADAARALPAPTLDTPANGANVQSAPIFKWKKVRRAAKYEFQLSADSGFRSIVTGGSVDTFNNAFTLDDSLPDGDYYWRVRAINAKEDAGRWSQGRSLTKRWSARPTLLTPTDEKVINYPSDPFLLRWEPVPHAVKYVVTVAADPALATQVVGTANNPVETVGTALSPSGSLQPGQYWWAVTPVDAVGHRGVRSVIGSFKWQWPSNTALHVDNLSSVANEFEPRFSWDRVPGAAHYEVEVNSAQDFAPGSKVCCADKSIGTSLAPKKVFPNNTYYWRVRAINTDGISGVWNEGPVFNKAFNPSIPNIHLRDNHGTIAPGSTTETPIIAWDPVPGAASYDVRLLPLVDAPDPSPDFCDTVHPATVVTTNNTAWTRLSIGSGTPVVNKTPEMEGDSVLLAGRKYCVSVRARAALGTAGERVVSDWTSFRGPNLPAFTYDPHTISGPSGTAVTDDDYVVPDDGSVTPRMPLFTWDHIPGACDYFVVVAKDESFTNVIDVARTKIPAYAPRGVYTDESTLYYWAVVPVMGAGPVVGTGCSAGFNTMQDNDPQTFRKDSVPPPPNAPGPNADVTDQPAFRWGTAEGAREYRLQVALDPTFGSLIDNIVTSSTAFTSFTTYPADAQLYWRIRANADSGTEIGLNWSPTRTFRRRLLAPTVGANPESDERVPVMTWNPVPGAISYDVSIEEPDGDNNLFSNLRTTVATPTKVFGLGTWQWRVRANFPTETGRPAAGPFSARRAFTRFMNPPTGARIERDNGSLVLDWDPSFGLAKEYKVEFSESSSFRTRLDSKRIDNAGYAPTMTTSGFQNGGPIYWRVAAVDEGGNVGGWASGKVGLLRKMTVQASGILRRGRKSVLEVRVTNAKNRVVKGVRVTLRGVGVRGRKRTGKKGIVRFKVKPKARGSVRVRGDKRGFRPGSAAVRVR
jgi:hypothetical protein